MCLLNKQTNVRVEMQKRSEGCKIGRLLRIKKEAFIKENQNLHSEDVVTSNDNDNDNDVTRIPFSTTLFKTNINKRDIHTLKHFLCNLTYFIQLNQKMCRRPSLYADLLSAISRKCD